MDVRLWRDPYEDSQDLPESDAMTSDEWLECNDPVVMIAALRGKASGRKLRLVAVGFCRQFPGKFGYCLQWPYESDHLSQRGPAIDRAELFADGIVGEDERAVWHRETSNFLNAARRDDDHDRERVAALLAINCTVHDVPYLSAHHVSSGWAVVDSARATLSRSIHCGIIRDIFGNPFHPLHPLLPTILTWNDHTVSRIAEGIYAERAFERMPILHDALLDAGCADEALLTHCRNPEGHVRGCWALDLILGKE
jgi:hypothetical protein